MTLIGSAAVYLFDRPLPELHAVLRIGSNECLRSRSTLGDGDRPKVGR